MTVTPNNTTNNTMRQIQMNASDKTENTTGIIVPHKTNECLYLSQPDEQLLLQSNNEDPMKYLEQVNSYRLLDEGEGEGEDLLDNGDLLNAPLLSLVVSNKNDTTPPWWKWKIPSENKSRFYSLLFIVPLLLLTLMCMIATIHPVPCSGNDYDDDDITPNPEPSNRTFYARQCATKLSNSNINPSSPQDTAVQWFISGQGRYIPIPTLDDCVWSTTFAAFYALITIRESLHITPWKSYTSIIINVSDACHHWTRIGCNDDNTIITNLHLNHANLTGTIPNEISLLQNIQRLELYSNNIHGSIPPSLGKMKLQYLYFHHTNISGSVPKALGELTHLQELLLDHTSLVGSVPDGVCALRGEDLHLLHADCEGVAPRVSCSCCDACY